MKRAKNYPQFTHFLSIPFIRQQYRNMIEKLQNKIEELFKSYKLEDMLKKSNNNLMHITISMLTLNREQTRQKSRLILQKLSQQIKQILSTCTLTLTNLKYFTRLNKQTKKKYINLFYIDFQQNQQVKKLQKVTDLIIRQMIKQQIIDANQLKSMHIKYDHKEGKYKNQQYHMTLFRVNEIEQDQVFQELFNKVQDIFKQSNHNISGQTSYQSQHQKQHINPNQSKCQKEQNLSKNLNLNLNLNLKCDFLDISTRKEYDQSKICKPLFRIIVNPDFK